MLKTAFKFPDLDSHPNFVKMEEERLERWYKDGVVEKYLHKNDESKKKFSFLDGPITANNPMGVHHGRGRTYKDLWQRYHTMRGERQRYQNGFDCQGLWVEVEVEKELGFKGKKDILGYGVEKFVNKCKQRVLKYAAIQTEQSKRLGMFMDWPNSYYTMSDENNYAIWNFLKVCHRRGWIYKGNDSVPWCPRCETAISQHEMLTEDYKEVTHESIIMEFPIEGRETEFLLVWTTTPWTIPANIAVAVDPKADYALVRGGFDPKDKFWVATKLVEKVFEGKHGRVVKTVKGKELVGWHYKSVFDGFEAVEKARKENPDKFHVVIATDPLIMPVSMEEGTGLVHTAVSAGTEDFKLGKKYGLPLIAVIADNADYLPGFGEFSGKNAKKNPRLILDYMEKREKEEGCWVFSIFPYTHRYPACWRCQTELVWKVTDEWYVAMDVRPLRNQKSKIKNQKLQTLREQLVDAAKKVRWIPGFGLERELDWLKNMHDWLISKKNRFWGLALPIWECDRCGYFDVIGGKNELREKSVKGWNKFNGHSPHKPWIDKVKIRCGKCGSEMSRIEPVGNPWLDAGIVSISTMPPAWFPADFITESFPGQFKNWFYSLLVMSTVLKGVPPFKTVLGFESVTGEDGRPMHKSWGNMIEFNEGAQKIGVDVMRWMYSKTGPTTVLPFGYKTGDEIRRRFSLILWNSFRFFVSQAKADNWTDNNYKSYKSYKNQGKNILDQWILVRLNETILAVTKSLDDYQSAPATAAIEKFVEDFSTWYIRRSRDRVGPSSAKDKQNAYQTMHFVLVNLSKLLAPFMPYISDYIYTVLTGEESVHLAQWPIGDPRRHFFGTLGQEPSLTSSSPLGHSSGKVLSGSSSMTSKMSPSDRLIFQMNLVREIVSLAHAQRKASGIPVRQPLSAIKVVTSFDKIGAEFEKLIMEEINVRRLDWVKDKRTTEIKVELDKKISDSLKKEGEARRIIRMIQKMRRQAGVGLTEKIEAGLADWPKGFEELIKRETLAEKLVKSRLSFVRRRV